MASRYRLPAFEIDDFAQEVRKALAEAGLDRMVNAAWIFETARHKAIDLLRKIESRRVYEATRTTSKSSYDPELLSLLRARIASLSDRLRKFYQLRYEEGLSEREVAQRLRLSRGSIRWMDTTLLRELKEP